MEINANFVYGLAYAFFIVVMAVVIVAAVLWRKFRNFLVEELSSKLVNPIKQDVQNFKDNFSTLERRVEVLEGRQVEHQQSIQQKFETIIRDVADLKGRLEGMLGKFDLYLKIGEKYGKDN